MCNSPALPRLTHVYSSWRDRWDEQQQQQGSHLSGWIGCCSLDNLRLARTGYMMPHSLHAGIRDFICLPFNWTHTHTPSRLRISNIASRWLLQEGACAFSKRTSPAAPLTHGFAHTHMHTHTCVRVRMYMCARSNTGDTAHNSNSEPRIVIGK